MGIKGLLTFVKSLPIPLEKIEEGSTLHIDGSGWCFQLIQQLNETFPSELPEYTLLGGLYFKFDQYIRQQVDYLQNGLKLHLIVYNDGSNKRMKEATAQRRCEDRNQQWCNLLSICMTQKYEKSNLPFPRLSIDQFLATIATLGIPIISCDTEADQDIAIAVSKANATSADHERHFAYANDSDFIVFADCPFIPFDSFTVLHEQMILAPVYLRSKISQLLELSEAQFVDLCILMGNDYTVEVDRNEFVTSCGIPPSLSHDVHSLISFIRSNQIFRSAMPKVQQIIDFSRELYELQDLSKYPYDTSRFVDIGSISKETKKHIEDWLHVSLKDYDYSNLNNVGYLALKYLTENKDTYPQFSNEHFESITEMLSNIGEAHSDDFYGLTVPEILLKMKWGDVEAATLYQNVCMKLISFFSNASSDLEKIIHHPFLNFDGHLYFSILNYRAVREATSLASSIERIKISDSASADLFPRNPYRNSAGDKLLKRIQPSMQNLGGKLDDRRRVGPGAVKPSRVDPLPIDEHREEIIHRIQSDRVIIIHGETGYD